MLTKWTSSRPRIECGMNCSRDPVHLKTAPLDAGYVIPDSIRDRHDDKNSRTGQIITTT